MTKDKQSMRRPGVLGVHSLDHFVLAVPDLDEANNFYSLFGLDVREENGSLGIYASENDHRWGVVVKEPKKHLKKLCFGCYEDDLPRFEEKLKELGVDYQPLDQSLHFADPAGMALEIRVADRVAPTKKAPLEFPQFGEGERSAPTRSDSRPTRPNRLSHLAMFTGELDVAIDFYSNVLGLRLSDRSLDIVAFMHAPHGSDHHLVAFLGSTGPGLHHVSWEVSSVDEVGIGAEHMAHNGFDYSWGLGRHVLGSNYFHYIRDPWGTWCEYSAGMEYIPADCDWDSGDYPPEDSFYLWGPEVAAGFTDNVEQQS
jgi:catechol 2,3-dioxygenase